MAPVGMRSVDLASWPIFFRRDMRDFRGTNPFREMSDHVSFHRDRSFISSIQDKDHTAYSSVGVEANLAGKSAPQDTLDYSTCPVRA